MMNRGAHGAQKNWEHKRSRESEKGTERHLKFKNRFHYDLVRTLHMYPISTDPATPSWRGTKAQLTLDTDLIDVLIDWSWWEPGAVEAVEVMVMIATHGPHSQERTATAAKSLLLFDARRLHDVPVNFFVVFWFFIVVLFIYQWRHRELDEIFTATMLYAMKLFSDTLWAACIFDDLIGARFKI